MGWKLTIGIFDFGHQSLSIDLLSYRLREKAKSTSSTFVEGSHCAVMMSIGSPHFGKTFCKFWKISSLAFEMVVDEHKSFRLVGWKVGRSVSICFRLE